MSATKLPPSKKVHLRKGDQVTVISGNHRGKMGRVLQIVPEKGQVIVEGVRMIKKHVRKKPRPPSRWYRGKGGPSTRLLRQGPRARTEGVRENSG